MLGALSGALAASSAAADSPRRWSVVPPTGWGDQSAEAKQAPEFQAQEAKLTTLGLEYDLAAYGSPTGDTIQILYAASRRSSTDPAAELRGWEAGARQAVAKVAKELSYERRTAGKVAVVDTVMAIGDERVYARYLAGFDPSLRMVSLTARCRGPEAICLAANRSVALDETALRALPSDARPPASDLSDHESESAYNQGRMMGIIIVLAGLVAWAFSKYLNKRKG